VIVVGGVVLELLASDMTTKLVGDHQLSCSSQSSERRSHGLVVVGGDGGLVSRMPACSAATA
jgi:hypothetical protein